MKELMVRKKDIEEYHGTLRVTVISKFFVKIVTEMPIHLKREIRTKRTDLIEVDRENRVHKFITRNASDELKQYLNMFKVIEK